MLSFEDLSAFRFSAGSVFILLACIFWGIENNCTRKLSEKDPLQIVLLKGIFSGGTSFVIALIIGERAENLWSVFAVLAVGLIAYAVAPFIGTALSLVIFREVPGMQFFGAVVLMIFGAWLSSDDKPLFKKEK